MVKKKLQINTIFSHVYGHQDKNCLIEDLPILEKINMECDIRSESDLCTNVQNNDPTPPGLNRETTVYRIYGTKVTYSVDESLRMKINHKELRSFIYDKRVL